MTKILVEHVSYAYQNKYRTVMAVNDVTYQFEAGKLYAIIGASGSGKTTLLSLLAGLDLPTSGTIAFDGKTTKELNRDNLRRDKVAVIYQGYNLFPLLTVMENVQYPLKMKKVKSDEAKQIAIEKLEAVGLNETYHKRLPSMLSGGEQQRVAIARALAGDGDVILADEPTGNLDTKNSRNIIHLLKELAHEQQYCVIVVTHDLSIAEEADEVLKMQDGCLKLGNLESFIKF